MAGGVSVIECAHLWVTRFLCQDAFKCSDCLLGLIHLAIQQSSVVLCIPIVPVSRYDLCSIDQANRQLSFSQSSHTQVCSAPYMLNRSPAQSLLPFTGIQPTIPFQNLQCEEVSSCFPEQSKLQWQITSTRTLV